MYSTGLDRGPQCHMDKPIFPQEPRSHWVTNAWKKYTKMKLTWVHKGLRWVCEGLHRVFEGTHRVGEGFWKYIVEYRLEVTYRIKKCQYLLSPSMSHVDFYELPCVMPFINFLLSLGSMSHVKMVEPPC